jgi:hypothetical protein
MNSSFLAHCGSIELLKRIPSESARLAYIDPPWEIEKPGRREDLLALYLHTAALSKACLANDGVIVWHAVPHLVSDIRSVLDRVYDRDNFQSEFVLRRKLRAPQDGRLAPGHSTLIVYSKTGKFHYSAPTRDASEKEAMQFRKQDSDGRLYREDSLFAPMERPSMSYEWHGQKPPPGRSWRYSRERLEKLAEEGRINFENGRIPTLRRYLDESPPPPLDSVWDDLAIPSAERAEGGKRTAQQPIELAQRILKAFTEEGDAVVDPYCGTGTFIVAAEALKRRWYGADNDESAIKITLARLNAITPSVCTATSAAEMEPLEIKHHLSELLKSYHVDQDPLSADTHILVNRDESKVLEFKQTLSLDLRTKKKEAHIGVAVLKTIAAFLNSDGGTLLIGVEDNNEIPGIEPELKELFNGSRDKFLLHFKSLLKDHIGADFYPLIDQRIVRLDEVCVMRVDVRPSPKPCFIGEDFYVRTNPATDRIGGQKLLDYIRQRFSGLF